MFYIFIFKKIGKSKVKVFVLIFDFCVYKKRQNVKFFKLIIYLYNIVYDFYVYVINIQENLNVYIIWFFIFGV